MARTIVHTVQDYVAQTKLHQGEGHEEYRCDRPTEKLMGLGCTTHAVEILISIAEFIATGDIAKYQELTGKKKVEA